MQQATESTSSMLLYGNNNREEGGHYWLVALLQYFLSGVSYGINSKVFKRQPISLTPKPTLDFLGIL